MVKIVVSGGPASIALPDLRGLRASEAAARLRKEGFKPQVRGRSSSTVPAGIVTATDPAAGIVTQQGATVIVFSSSGPALVNVPDLSGESLSGAETALTAAGLTRGAVTKQPSSSQPAGTVLSQEPTAGTQVQHGAKVDLVIAQAPKAKQVNVPTVVGRTELSAEEAIEHAGFTSQVSSTLTGEASDVGKVLRQSPSGGTKAAKGSTVRIFIGVAGGSTTPTTTTPTTPAPTPPSRRRPASDGHQRTPLRGRAAGGRARRRALLRARGLAVIRRGRPRRPARRRPRGRVGRDRPRRELALRGPSR